LGLDLHLRPCGAGCDYAVDDLGCVAKRVAGGEAIFPGTRLIRSRDFFAINLPSINPINE
jgi:hypothetical protein